MKSYCHKYKICLVSDQLAGGGAERCSALLSQYFDKHNCDVHHVIVLDHMAYEYAGEVLNLGKLKKGNFNFADRFNRFFTLYNFFRQNKFDFIIDTRAKNKQWQELIITKFIFNAPTIMVVHSYMTQLYFPKFTFLAKYIYKKCFKIIAVSHKIQEKIFTEYQYKQVETIYNPIDLKFIINQAKELLDVNFNYILAVGNMHIDVKQFDKLIDAYSKSKLPDLNIKLVLIGDGILRSELQNYAESLTLKDHVIFTGSLSNPFPYYKNALFTVLSSKNEGFPNVLLESLACETPIIAFDCLSGPSEIITDRENGLLVENQNIEKLTEAVNELFFDEKLYYHCKQNAKRSVARFSLEIIGEKWLELMKIK